MKPVTSEAHPQRQGRRKALPRVSYRWLLGILGLILFSLLIAQVSPTELLSTLRQAHLEFILLAMLFGFSANLVRIVRFNYFFPSGGRWVALYAAFALIRWLNYVLPFRTGEAAALVVLKKLRLSPSIAETSPVWLLMRVCDLTGLFLLVGIALLVDSSTLVFDQPIGLLVTMLIIGSVVAAISIPLLGRWWGKRSVDDSTGWFAARLRDLRMGLNRVVSGRAIVVALAGALLTWTANVAVAVCALMAFNVPIGVTSCILASSLILAIHLLPIRPPLGLGTSDAAWVGILILLGVQPDIAITLAIGVRIVQMLLAGVDGALGFALSRRST